MTDAPHTGTGAPPAGGDAPPGGTPPDDAAAPHTDAQGADDLADLDDRARALVERANNEAAARRRDLRAAEAARDRAIRERDEARQSAESDTERAVREAEQRGHDAAAQVYERRLVGADIIAAASGRLRDPHDAAAHIDLDPIITETDADRRSRMITDELDRLLDAKPYLAAPQNGGAGGPLVTQGGRSTAPGDRAATTNPDEWLRRQARRS